MLNRTLATLLCSGLFMLPGMSSALASIEPIPGVDVIVKKDPGGASIMAVQTDGNGAVVLKGLAPGDYELVIDGPSFVRAMDKVTPAPEKKSGGGFSLGIGGGMFGGGGSRHSSSGGGQGAGPVQGGPQGGHGGSHSSGGGMGFGLSIPVGGGGDQKTSGGGVAITGITISLPSNPGMTIETPYCRDSAVQGLRIHFTVPQGAPSEATLSIFDRWGNLSALDDSNTTMQDVSTTR